MSTLHMLRALVDQRLTAAVEEIFVVLERTIAEYEAELSRTKEENNQLLDAVFKKHQVVLHRTDVQQPPHIIEEEEDPQTTQIKEEEADPQPTHMKEEEEDPQPTHMKEEEEDPQPTHMKEEEDDPQPTHIKEEEEDPQPTYMKEEEEDPHMKEEEEDPHMKEEEEDPHMKEEEEGECVVEQEEDDVSKFPLTVVSVKTEEHEDKAPESSQLHHSPNIQQPPHMKEEEEDPQPTHMKEEEEDPLMKEEEEGECVVGQEEDDVSKFPLTVVSVKTEEHEDKAPESSQLHHSPSKHISFYSQGIQSITTGLFTLS
nr:protein TsetseEP-like isoform X2 [Nerophis lumbriciformis]